VKSLARIPSLAGAWKAEYFALHDMQLQYFVDDKSKTPKGSVAMAGITQVAKTGSSIVHHGKKYDVVVLKGLTTKHLASPVEETDSWIAALSACLPTAAPATPKWDHTDVSLRTVPQVTSATSVGSAPLAAPAASPAPVVPTTSSPPASPRTLEAIAHEKSTPALPPKKARAPAPASAIVIQTAPDTAPEVHEQQRPTSPKPLPSVSGLRNVPPLPSKAAPPPPVVADASALPVVVTASVLLSTPAELHGSLKRSPRAVGLREQALAAGATRLGEVTTIEHSVSTHPTALAATATASVETSAIDMVTTADTPTASLRHETVDATDVAHSLTASTTTASEIEPLPLPPPDVLTSSTSSVLTDAYVARAFRAGERLSAPTSERLIEITPSSAMATDYVATEFVEVRDGLVGIRCRTRAVITLVVAGDG
jgi:hypothetical protein